MGPEGKRAHQAQRERNVLGVAGQLMLKKKYHAKGITKADPTAKASENLIQQNFIAAAPNQKWLGDITEIPTADGKLYLSAVLDCYDGARMESFFATLKKECMTK